MEILPDILECDDDNGGCQQICNDFLGGYYCSCDPGFRPFTPDASKCEGTAYIYMLCVKK